MQRLHKPEHGSIEWRMIRHRDDNGNCTFGASEAGAVIGVSEWTTTADLFISKLNEPVITPPTPGMLKGILFESALGEHAAKILRTELVTPDEMFRKGRWTATLDFWNPTTENLIVECKVTNAYEIQTSDDLPASWVAQGHVQHWVTGADVFFSVFDKHQRLSVVPMLIDDALLDELNIQAEVLGQAVDAGTIPDWINDMMSEQNVRETYPPRTGTETEANIDLMYWVQDLEDAKKLKKQAEDTERTAREMIARFMRDTERLTYEGRTVLTWKEQAGRTSFETERFRAEHPDLAAQYEKQGSPIRVMRLGRGNK